MPEMRKPEPQSVPSRGATRADCCPCGGTADGLQALLLLQMMAATTGLTAAREGLAADDPRVAELLQHAAASVCNRPDPLRWLTETAVAFTREHMPRLRTAARHYCAPYNRELEHLGLAPLSDDGQFAYMMTAALLQPEPPVPFGHRVPLLQLAIVSGRRDIALAIAARDGLHKKASARYRQQDHDWQADADRHVLAELGDAILPELEQRLNAIPWDEAGKAIDRIAGEAAVVRAMADRAHNHLRREQTRRRRERDPLQGDDPRMADPEGVQARAGALGQVDLGMALAEYLRRSESDLDRRILELLTQCPGLSECVYEASTEAAARWVASVHGTREVRYGSDGRAMGALEAAGSPGQAWRPTAEHQ